MSAQVEQEPSPAELDAAQTVMRKRLGPWTARDQSEFTMRTANDPEYAAAVSSMESSWSDLGAYSAAPEIMKLREQALSRTRRDGANRWLRPLSRGSSWRWAAIAAVMLIAIAGLKVMLSYQPTSYVTSRGEQRIIDLADGSRIVLDARTRLSVHYTADARLLELSEGRAQFTVAKDVARPFKVSAGERTFVALGTEFTVEFLDDETRVAMLEGRVAVMPREQDGGADSAGDTALELSSGQELRVRQDGRATVLPKADIAAATAWRSGRIVFESEPLGVAVRRMNRYSSDQIEIDDPELAALVVTGTFDADDAPAFARSLEAYFPVVVDHSSAGIIRVRHK